MFFVVVLPDGTVVEPRVAEAYLGGMRACRQNAGKYQIFNLDDAIEPLKTRAREIGANGIVKHTLG
jgi:hypothetical protein